MQCDSKVVKKLFLIGKQEEGGRRRRVKVCSCSFCLPFDSKDKIIMDFFFEVLLSTVRVSITIQVRKDYSTSTSTCTSKITVLVPDTYSILQYILVLEHLHLRLEHTRVCLSVCVCLRTGTKDDSR